MARCKDCVHVEVCSEYVEGLAAVRGLKLGDVKGISAILQCDDCDHFKDRSRFVELPAKIVERYYIDIDQAKTVSDMLLIISQNFEYNGDSSSTFKSYFIGVGDAIESCLKVLTPFWKEQEKDG